MTTTRERVFLSERRIKMSRLLGDMKQEIAKVPSKLRKEVFKTTIIGLKTLEGKLIGGNRILYKQIMNMVK